MASVRMALVQDTWVRDTTPDQNRAGDTFNSTGRFPNPTAITRAYWKIGDWAKIPDGAFINSAFIYARPVLIFNNEFNITAEWYENSGGWESTTLTWNTQPGFITTRLDAIAYSTDKYYPANITTNIRRARFSNTAYRNYGVRSTIFGTDFHGIDFSSLQGTYPPYVIANYVSLAPTINTPTEEANASYVRGTGGAVDFASTIEVWSAAATGGTYTFLKNATLNTTNGYSYTYIPVAAAPAAPSMNAPTIINGDEISLSWSYPTTYSAGRAFKTRRILSDGTTSVFTGEVYQNVTPPVTEWRVQRNTGSGWSTLATITGVTPTSARTYVDKTLPLNTQGTYRVLAENSQNTVGAGDSSPPSITIVPPNAPTLSSVVPVNNTSFALSGGSAPVSGTRKLEIYVSADGINYTAMAGIDSPTTSSWTAERLPTAIGTSPAYIAPHSPTPSVAYVQEKRVDFNWSYSGIVPNPGTKRWFRARAVVDGIASAYSAAVAATVTPTITGFKVERKLEALDDSYYTQIHPATANTITAPNVVGYSDNSAKFGESYTYRVTAYNNITQANGLGMPSTPLTKAGRTQPPLAPVSFPARLVVNEDKSEKIRISGKGRTVDGQQANNIYVQKQGAGLVWGDLPAPANLSNSGTGPADEEWWIDDNSLGTSKPAAVSWSLGNIPVDTSGIYLNWNTPSNPSVTGIYRSIRELIGKDATTFVRGNPSPTVSLSVQPFVRSYTIFRKTLLKTGETPHASDTTEFQPITTIAPGPADLTPSTFFFHTSAGGESAAVQPEKTYIYKVVATNNFGQTSNDSAEITLTTFNRPPAIIPPPELPPVIGNPRPKGSINVSGGGTINFIWDYAHPASKPQSEYSLKATWTEAGVAKQMHWNNLIKQWDLQSITRIFNKTSKTSAEVNVTHPTDKTKKVFENGIRYKLSLVTRSSLSLGIASSDTVRADVVEGESTTLDWEITGADAYTLYFPTRRSVKKRYVSRFPTYRRVNRAEATDINLPSLSLVWNVEAQLPLEVDDEKWEGGGNSWIHTVFDYDGRPEPYAEVDFEKPGFGKTFQCDSRGRLVIRVPGDLNPGIYTFRERGPTMAPRTTRDFSVVDPSIIYNHAHRHNEHGEDPLFGLTNKQFSDNAKIHPSKVEGGKSLGDLVDAYGSNIQEGLERSIAAGHGYYVVSGLDRSSLGSGSVTITAGVCWENERLRSLDDATLQIISDGTYKIFVQEGVIKIENRESHPPKSTPLYTLVVSGGITIGTFTDDRLRHPNASSPKTLTPVKWGAKISDDLYHKDRPLRNVLDENIDLIQERKRIEDNYVNDFYNKVNDTSNKIDLYNVDVAKARDAMLTTGYAVSMKQLYSLFNRRAADNLLLEPDNARKLQEQGMTDIVSYLAAIKNGGGNQKSANVSAFQSGDELASLTNIIIVNGLARLPNNWVKGTQYTLRTLRVEGAPARVLEFHLIYEDTKANFVALGSLGNNGRYIPKQMLNTRITKDNTLKEIFGTAAGVNVYVNTYRAEFNEPGDEAIIELLCTGGNPGDGIRLRGFSIVTA